MRCSRSLLAVCCVPCCCLQCAVALEEARTEVYKASLTQQLKQAELKAVGAASDETHACSVCVCSGSVRPACVRVRALGLVQSSSSSCSSSSSSSARRAHLARNAVIAGAAARRLRSSGGSRSTGVQQRSRRRSSARRRMQRGKPRRPSSGGGVLVGLSASPPAGLLPGLLSYCACVPAPPL